MKVIPCALYRLAANESLMAGIEQVKPDNRLGDVSHAIQKRAESDGFSVVTAFVGHGIGTSPHEEPQVPNFGSPGKGFWHHRH